MWGWLRSMALLGYFVALVGGVFLLDGGWKSYSQYVEYKDWPEVEAHVVKCSIGGSAFYSSSRHAPVESLRVKCTFAYTVGSTARESTVDVGDQITVSQGRVWPPPKVTRAKMEQWIAHHQPGSIQIIHYESSNPSNISLASANNDLQELVPGDRLLFGVITFAIGIVLIAIGRRQS
jgi:hypothetical protein